MNTTTTKAIESQLKRHGAVAIKRDTNTRCDIAEQLQADEFALLVETIEPAQRERNAKLLCFENKNNSYVAALAIEREHETCDELNDGKKWMLLGGAKQQRRYATTMGARLYLSGVNGDYRYAGELFDVID